MFKCQDNEEKLQRATMLVDIMSQHCDDASFSSFCESLVTFGQKHIVDNYLRRNDARNLQSPGNDAVVFCKYKLKIQ